MTNCNNPQFPSMCTNASFSKLFTNTGDLIYYQEITDTSIKSEIDNRNLLDGVVLINLDGKYYKAIYNENTINIEWYRCSYTIDLNTGDKDMITKAINTAGYLGAILKFDAKEYIVNEQLSFCNLSCFKLLGDKQHTLIRSDKSIRFESFFLSFTSCQSIIIEGIKFDQNKRNLPVYTTYDDSLDKEYNGAIFITLSKDIEIKDCSFFDLYNRAVRIYYCDFMGNIKIINNYFESEVQQQIYRMEHLTVAQSHTANILIENNTFKNAENHDSSKAPCGIFAFDLGLFGAVNINNNNFDYCGRDNTGHHRLYAIDFYDNVNNFIISKNVFRNCTWGAIRFDGIRKNGIICDNIIHQLIPDDTGIINASSREAVQFNQTEFKNITITNNILESATLFSYGITIQGLSPFCAAENIEISHNKMYNLRYGIKIHGDVSGVSINNNQAINLIGIGIQIDGFKTGDNHAPMEPKKIEKIYITNNHLNGRKELDYDGFVGIQVNGLESNASFMGRVLISDNFISGNTKGRGIIINTGKTLENVITIVANTIENVKEGFFIRTKKVFVKDNLIYHADVAINDSDVPGETIYHENFYNNILI